MVDGSDASAKGTCDSFVCCAETCVPKSVAGDRRSGGGYASDCEQRTESLPESCGPGFRNRPVIDLGDCPRRVGLPCCVNEVYVVQSECLWPTGVA